MQNISFYNLPSKEGKINICATVILTFVVCGYETWYLTLWVLGRCARVVDHLAVENVAQGAPPGGGSTLHYVRNSK